MIEFRNGRHRGRGIILDQPRRGVVGIVECASEGCEAQLVLTVEDGHGDPDRLATAIDDFMKKHPCGEDVSAEN